MKVQAFKRSLPKSTRGIQFQTYVEPDPDGHPHIACWSGDRPGLFERSDAQGDFVAIQVHDFKNEQPPVEGGVEWQSL